MSNRDYLKHLGFATAAAIVTANKTKAMSNEPTIAEMNRAICEFMGWEYIRVGYFGSNDGDIEYDESEWQVINEHWMDKVGMEDVGYYIVNVKENKWHEWSYVKYHSSWDQLMPVVKKIYDTLAEMLKKRPPHTACQGDLIEVDIHCAIREVDILKAHGYVYQFCLWYKKKEAI